MANDNEAILAILEAMRHEVAEHGLSEHAEALWHKALLMRRDQKPHDPNDPAPTEELPAMLRPQAM